MYASVRGAVCLQTLPSDLGHGGRGHPGAEENTPDERHAEPGILHVSGAETCDVFISCVHSTR